MKEFCENTLCENPGVKEVPVSIKKNSDQKRTFCSVCEEAYTIGCQHGRFGIQEMEFWLVAIADSGIVNYVRVHSNEKPAWRTVVGYLRENEGYRGSHSPQAIRDWLDQHERLSVEVMSQKGLPDTPYSEDRRTLTRTERYLTQERFILMTRNSTDPHPGCPFEAWAYEGPLDLTKAFPNCFGVGASIVDSLEALNLQLKDWASGKSNEIISRKPGDAP